MQMNTTMIAVIGCGACCLSLLAFMVFAYMNPDTVPFMQPFFDMFRKKDDDDDDEGGIIYTPTNTWAPGPTPTPSPTPAPPFYWTTTPLSTTCPVTPAELERWKQQCSICTKKKPRTCSTRPGCVERKHREKCAVPGSSACTLTAAERQSCGCAAGPDSHQQRVCGPKYAECLARKRAEKCKTPMPPIAPPPPPPPVPSCSYTAAEMAAWRSECGRQPCTRSAKSNCPARYSACVEDKKRAKCRTPQPPQPQPPGTCYVTAADMTQWRQACGQTPGCVQEYIQRKCGSALVAYQ